MELTARTSTLRKSTFGGQATDWKTMESSTLYVEVFVVILVLWCSFAEAELVKCRGCKLRSRHKPAVPHTLSCVLVDCSKGFPPCLVKEANKRPTTTELILAACRLTTLSPGAFIGLTNIQTLSIGLTKSKRWIVQTCLKAWKILRCCHSSTMLWKKYIQPHSPGLEKFINWN